LAHVQKLDVYQKSQDFIKQIYSLTKSYPTREQFGIVDQIRRATVSISANIAEGCGRYHNKEFIQFLRIARGSAYEVIALLDASLNLQFIKQSDYEESYKQAEQINRMLNGLMNSMRNGVKNEKEQ
jgi:four helix bundle protein